MNRGELQKGFRLAEWTVGPLEGRIEGPSGPRRIQPRTMDVLVCLAERAGEVLPRETLTATVWAGSPVAEESLTRCIGEL